VFDHSVFTHNRDRLGEHGITQKFFDSVVKQAIDAGLTSDEHFTVDGSLIQSHAASRASRGSSGRLPRNRMMMMAAMDRHPALLVGVAATPRWTSRASVAATPRTAARPTRRRSCTGRVTGVGAFLCHSGHAVTENRHGLVMSVRIDEASGTAERESTLKMLDHLQRRHGVRPATLGADKGYDSGPFLVELERRWIEPHVAIKSGRVDPLRQNADEGTWARWFVRSEQRRAAFKKSQRRRKLVEEFFGWAKTVAGMRRARHVGRDKIRQCFEMAAAAYNLVRMKNLLAA
jgi:hypothetical protein